MKKRLLIVISLICLLLFSCQKVEEIFSFDNSVTVTVQIDASTLSVSNIKAQSLAESVGLNLGHATSTNLRVFSNSKPQIIAITDNDNHLLMMYRGPVKEGDTININAHSTANALITFNPLYGPVPADDYTQMISVIENSPYYADYGSAIESAILQGIDLADSSNSHVLAMMYNLLRDISELAFSGQALIDSSIVTNGSDLNLYPLFATENGSSLTLQTSNNCPSYYGTLRNAEDSVIQQVSVPAAGRYGFMDNFNSSPINNSLGTPVNIHFSEDGLYTLELSCTEESAIVDFYVRFVNNILAAIGADIDASIVSAITPLVRKAVRDNGIDITAVTSDQVMDIICQGYDIVIDYLRGQSVALSGGNANWELGTTLLHRLNDMYGSIRSSTEALLSTSWGFIEDEDNEDDSNVIRRRFLYTGATLDKYKLVASASLKYFSGNNQKGAAFEVLSHEIKVKMYNAHDEHGQYIHSNNRQVKFVAISGNGTFGDNDLSEYVATTGITGIASATWRLGYGISGGTQTCYAVAIDSSGNEVSNRVYFKALVSNVRYRISLCCDWANHNNYASQFDVDLTLASHGTGVVNLVTTVGSQWDYDHSSEAFRMTGTYNTATRYTDMSIEMFTPNISNGWKFRTDRYQFTWQGYDIHVAGTLIYDGFDHGSPYGAGCGTYICVRQLGENEAPITPVRPQKASTGKALLVAKK